MKSFNNLKQYVDGVHPHDKLLAEKLAVLEDNTSALQAAFRMTLEELDMTNPKHQNIFKLGMDLLTELNE